MRLAPHHTFALAGAAGLSAIALFDAVTHGLTGQWSVFADDSPVPWLQRVGDVIHGLAYLGALWVLYAERRHVLAGRVARVLGWVLAASFAVLAATFLVVSPLSWLGLDGLMGALSGVVGVAFLVQLLAGMALGLTLWRRPATAPGNRVLAAALPAVLVTVALGFVAADWAHPAYVETCVIVGTALLGAAARPAAEPAAALDEVGARRDVLS